jgi:hypothetical protein
VSCEAGAWYLAVRAENEMEDMRVEVPTSVLLRLRSSGMFRRVDC